MRRSLLLITILTALLGGLFLPATASAAGEGTSEVVIAVPFRGVANDCQNPGNEGKKCVADLSTYIAAFYRFFSGAVGVLAAVMIMWGGFKWLTAAGNSSRVSDARDTIYSAIVAIILTLGAYVLLRTINPELVKLNLPSVSDVDRLDLASLECIDNPIELIDFSSSTYLGQPAGACDPTDLSSNQCCGYEFNVTTQGGKVTCLNADTKVRTNVCYSVGDVTQEFSKFTQWKIEDVRTYCAKANDSNEGCIGANAEIQRERLWSLDTSRTGKKKFVGAACGGAQYSFEDTSRTNCTFDLTFQSVSQLTAGEQADYFPSGYETKFYGCLDQAAKGACWDDIGGVATVKNCVESDEASGQDGYFGPCQDLNSTQPVVGASFACMKNLATNEFSCRRPNKTPADKFEDRVIYR